MPRRRTFASAFRAAAHSDADFASPSWLRSSSYAGSQGMGGPSPPVTEPLGPAATLTRRLPPPAADSPRTRSVAAPGDDRAADAAPAEPAYAHVAAAVGTRRRLVVVGPDPPSLLLRPVPLLGAVVDAREVAPRRRVPRSRGLRGCGERAGRESRENGQRQTVNGPGSCNSGEGGGRCRPNDAGVQYGERPDAVRRTAAALYFSPWRPPPTLPTQPAGMWPVRLW
jgi:hypothetical protein